MIRFQKKRKRYRYVLLGGILTVGSFIFIGTLYKGSMPFLNKVSWSESQQLSQLFPTYKENATLKNELATESQAEANVYKIKHKNKELTELLKVQNGMTAYNPISATVIDRSISNWDNELIIDKGAKRGIKVDMNVLNSNGVIGKVAKVFS
ncbi:hypothetical protein COK01_16555 [Priestia megaterium]|nr:rod shape-determining protein MreC [Priestia megaterium]PFK63343.1 hypothetical protein COJ21_26805 [Priestia megaterium]PFP47687.1 hypothetical protein COK01_16555 [Priestia megaterium]RFB19459.1 rod shape-determining protein MreC [Bacillus sp. ALD]